LGPSQWLFWRAPITGSMIVVQSARFSVPMSTGRTGVVNHAAMVLTNACRAFAVC